MTRNWQGTKMPCCSPTKVIQNRIFHNLPPPFLNSPLPTEAQLDFEEDLPPTKTSTQTHFVENKIELVDDQRVEAEQQSQTCTAVEILEEPHKPEEEPQPAEEEEQQQQICQFTVEQPVTNDEECVSSTNECPKESDSENFSAPPDSDTSPSKRSSKEDLDYSSFDNGKQI